MNLSLFGRLDRPASAVLFAGLGGACEGIRRATGTSPLSAINHDPHAIALHKRNHPETKHFPEDVWEVSPRRGARGRKLGLLWMSPDCRDFSRAKGGQPVSVGVRSLANVAHSWIQDARPNVLMLENVPEFEGWGPLYPDDHPNPKLRGRRIPERKGEFFKEWVGRVRAAGYEVEWRNLVAADYGAPTSRKRLYLIARCDGRPIVWPEPTHGPGRPLPWRTAAECIDWDIEGRSIFGRKKPLADATLRRIAAGLVRFVLRAPRPFLLCHTHGGRLEPIDEPMRTITTARRGERAVVTPYLTKFYGTSRDGANIGEPMPTVTAGAGGGHLGLVAPYLVQTGQGERRGQAPRVLDLHKPLTTVVAGGQRHGLVSAFLAKHYTGAVGSDLGAPMGTVTAVDHHSLVTASLAPEEEAGARRVAAFLVSYYGQSIGQMMTEPMPTVTTKDRFGLVTVLIEGQPYVVTDIRMRMLRPRELARAMGFPDSYILEGTLEQQVARVGNAVCPDVAEALVRANL